MRNLELQYDGRHEQKGIGIKHGTDRNKGRRNKEQMAACMGETRAVMQSICANGYSPTTVINIYYGMYMVAYIYEGLQPENTSNDVMYYM